MEKHSTIKSGRLWFLGVDFQENSGGTPEARSRLCVLSGFLPHDLCHGWDSSHWFPTAFQFSSFLSYLSGLLRQPFCLFAFLFLEDGFDHHLQYGVCISLYERID